MANRSMGRSASSIGMMEGAYFVSRTELLTWVNGLLQMNLQKVEQCASGAVYCAILDACNPYQVAMQKINWMAKVDHEFLPNYKVLQQAFHRLHIDRHIAVDQLIRGKYQDNLEFLQWMKCYWEREGQTAEDDDYDPVERRAGKPTPPYARAPGVVSDGGGEKENSRPQRSARPVSAEQKPRPAPVVEQKRPLSGTAARLPVRPPAADMASLRNRVLEQDGEIEDLQDTVEGLEKERDYYFQRLRNVEILCVRLQTQMEPGLTPEALVRDVLDILYKEDVEEGGAVEEA